MNTHADKTQETKSQSVANAVSQRQVSSASSFQFVDNRPEFEDQKKLTEIIGKSPKVYQFKYSGNPSEEIDSSKVVQMVHPAFNNVNFWRPPINGIPHPLSPDGQRERMTAAYGAPIANLLLGTEVHEDDVAEREDNVRIYLARHPGPAARQHVQQALTNHPANNRNMDAELQCLEIQGEEAQGRVQIEHDMEYASLILLHTISRYGVAVEAATARNQEVAEIVPAYTRYREALVHALRLPQNVRFYNEKLRGLHDPTNLQLIGDAPSAPTTMAKLVPFITEMNRWLCVLRDRIGGDKIREFLTHDAAAFAEMMRRFNHDAEGLIHNYHQGRHQVMDAEGEARNALHIRLLHGLTMEQLTDAVRQVHALRAIVHAAGGETAGINAGRNGSHPVIPGGADNPIRIDPALYDHWKRKGRVDVSGGYIIRSETVGLTYHRITDGGNILIHMVARLRGG